MLLYLKQAWQKRLDEQKGTEADLLDAIGEGAVLRVRPKAMTATVILAGLLPIMFGSGTGSEVMQRIAAPMVGGMVESLSWPAMTMGFSVKDEALLTKLKVGETVDFEFMKVEQGYVITEVK